jgi:hypothetical protein
LRSPATHVVTPSTLRWSVLAPDSTSPATLAGRLLAYSRATYPHSDWPTTCAGSSASSPRKSSRTRAAAVKEYDSHGAYRSGCRHPSRFR